MPGEEIEPFDFNHATGATLRDYPLSTKAIDTAIAAAPVEFKFASDKAAGVISGYGSVFGVRDMHGDIVEQSAFSESLRKHTRDRTAPAMLWSHDPDRPIGVWDVFQEDTHGLKMSGRLNLDTQDGREAHALLKQGALSGLSIGYRINSGGAEVDRSGIRRLKSVELWEVSVVTFPSNRDARITGVKAMESLRDFEGFLRTSGFPKTAARKIAAGGWNALRSDEPDAADLIAAVKQATLELKAKGGQ